MSEHDRFMGEVFRIVSGALRLDIDKVRNYTAFLADKLEGAGEVGSANRLRKLLQESDHALRPAGATVARTPPVDSESRFPLVERVDLRRVPEPAPVLSSVQQDVVTEFVSVAKSHSQLEAEGVDTSLTLLIYGPPGVGKSMLARFIARELDLPLYIARLDGLISSFLGSTSKNIRALFEFAARTPCVLFLDEFDAIAKLRGDDQELGELKRVVNSFIQNLDALGSGTIVVAATNHEELLDRAIWRRFAYRLQLGLPGLPERLDMLSRDLLPMGFAARELEVLADLSEGYTGSDLREVQLRLRRRQLAQGSAPVLAEAFRCLLSLASGEGKEGRFLSDLVERPPEAIVEVLRIRSPRLYSWQTLGELLGVSKATAYRMGRELQARQGRRGRRS